MLADILASLHVLWLRDHSAAGPHLARVKLSRSEVGGLVMKLGAAAADLDGQLRLSMGEGEEPRIDDLFAAAETAEEEGDLDRAEVLYRRCIDIDRSDPTIPSISPRRTCGAALMAMRCDVSNATSRSIWAASGARAP